MIRPFGSPALTLLLRLKLRGLVRRQWRRLRTPKGLLLTLLGCAAFGAWIGSLAFSMAQPRAPLGAAEAELRARASGLMLFLLSLGTALTNRGLYLPRNEIERLFSAPLARADLVRYRLLAGALRSLLGGVVVGLFAARRMPQPVLAFGGVVLAMQTLPVVNQLVAIALGGLQQRAAQALKRVGSLLLTAALAGLGALAFALVTGRSPEHVPWIGSWLADLLAPGAQPLAHPVFARLTLPFAPWARMIAAPTSASFAAWFGACLVLHAFLVELTARLPIDFRELSLSTSARAAARLARVRRGGGVASTRASARSARWRIPWLFGHGPAGAIAWRKCAGMARKAKGAFWVALVALLFIVLLTELLLQGSGEERGLLAPLMIAVLGTIYLCSGLRFDFREELERMDVIRAWPIAPAQVFLAMLLPEVVLVSALLALTVLAQAVLADGLSPYAAGTALLLPFLVFSWVALDNAVFLFAPVRVVPGQDGFVQNAGRRMIQVALLLFFGVLELGLGALAGWGTYGFALHALGGSPGWSLSAAFTVLLLWLAAWSGALAWLGGAVLRRFDVARDRG